MRASLPKFSKNPRDFCGPEFWYNLLDQILLVGNRSLYQKGDNIGTR